jgi:hypothetical protein
VSDPVSVDSDCMTRTAGRCHYRRDSDAALASPGRPGQAWLERLKTRWSDSSRSFPPARLGCGQGGPYRRDSDAAFAGATRTRLCCRSAAPARPGRPGPLPVLRWWPPSAVALTPSPSAFPLFLLLCLPASRPLRNSEKLAMVEMELVLTTLP